MLFLSEEDTDIKPTASAADDSSMLLSFFLFTAYSIDSPPGNDSFREGLCFAGIYFSCNLRAPGPISTKFCTTLRAAFSFIIPVQNFEGASPTNFRDQKHAKFGPILVDFKVR